MALPLLTDAVSNVCVAVLRCYRYAALRCNLRTVVLRQDLKGKVSDEIRDAQHSSLTLQVFQCVCTVPTSKQAMLLDAWRFVNLIQNQIKPLLYIP